MTNTTQQVSVAHSALPTNPFATERHQHINQGAVAIEEQRAIAEAQGKLLVAKRFPRDQAAAYERIMKACARKGLAEQAMYSYPRGGQVVTGPSIRLAEELARSWGNIEYGIRELSQKDGVSEMEAYCWDLETNVVSSQKFTVKHERHTKTGITKLNDPRDIYELTANQAGRRLRARILAVLPPDIIENAVQTCYATLAGKSDEPIEDRVRKMLQAFAKFGVNKEHIEARIGKKLDSILADELVELQTIYTSLRDNMSRPSDWFGGADAPAPEPIAELNKQVAEAKADPKPSTKRSAKKQEPPVVDVQSTVIEPEQPSEELM